MKTIELTKEEIEKLSNGKEVNIYHKEQCADGSSVRIVGMNGYEGVTIKKKVEQWEPKGGEYYITCDGFIEKTTISDSNLNKNLFGNLFSTKSQAERAARNMRTFNRLLAYVDEFDPEYEWRCGEANYYIIVDSNTNKFEYDYDAFLYKTGMVYMSQEVAQELCRKLNSGEVIL